MWWWHSVLVVGCCLTHGTQAHAPITWMQTPSSGHTLMPKGFKGWSSVNTVPPQELVIGSLEKTSPGIVPYFTAKSDNSITWDDMGWCVEASGRASEAAVRVNHCNGDADQKWNWIPDGQGRTMIQLKDTNKCLDVREGSLEEASIELRDCASQMTDGWNFGESLLLPTVTPAGPFGVRRSWVSLLSIAGVGMLGLGAWMWRPQTKARVMAAGQGGVSMSLVACGDIEASIDEDWSKKIEGADVGSPAPSFSQEVTTIKKPGTIGHRHTPETRAKISAAKKGKQTWNTGQPHPEETRKRIAEGVQKTKLRIKEEKQRERERMRVEEPLAYAALLAEEAAKVEARRAYQRQRARDRWAKLRAEKNQGATASTKNKKKGRTSAETRAKISNSIRELWKDPEYRARRANNTVSEATRLKISNTMKAKWLDGELRSRARRKPFSEERKAKIAASIRAKWADPEYREKTMMGIKHSRTKVRVGEPTASSELPPTSIEDAGPTERREVMTVQVETAEDRKASSRGAMGKKKKKDAEIAWGSDFPTFANDNEERKILDTSGNKLN